MGGRPRTLPLVQWQNQHYGYQSSDHTGLSIALSTEYPPSIKYSSLMLLSQLLSRPRSNTQHTNLLISNSMAISIEATVSIVAVVLAIVPMCISGVKCWRARHTHHPSELAKLFISEGIHDTHICEDRPENHILPVYHSGDRVVSRNQGTPAMVQALQRQDSCFYGARGKSSNAGSRSRLTGPNSDPIRRRDVSPNYEHNDCASKCSSNGPCLTEAF